MTRPLAPLAYRIGIVVAAVLATLAVLQSAVVQLVAAGALPGPVVLFGDARTVLLRDDVAEPMLATRDRLPPASLATARAAHGADPLDPLPFVVAGLAGPGDARALPLFEQAVRRDPRSGAARLHLIRATLQAGRYDRGTLLLAQTIGLRPDQAQTLIPALLLARAAPGGDRTVMRAMRRDAGLRDRAAVFLAGTPDPDRLLPRLAAIGLSPGARTAAIAQLARGNRFADAYRLWRGSDAGGASEPFDPELRGLEAPAPFGWTLASDSNLNAFFGDDDGSVGKGGDDGGHLSAEMFGRVRTPVVTQSILLPPGRYRLTAAARSQAPPLTGGAFDWTVACADAREGEALTSVRFPAATPGVQTRAATFTIAAGCPAQTLALVAVPGDNGRSFAMRFAFVRVEPA